MSDTYNAFNHKEWSSAGLQDYENFSDSVEYVNQQDCGDGSRGEWFYADKDTLTIYSGSFSDDHSPGASSYTYAEVFEDADDYNRSLAIWEACPEYLESDEDEDEDDDWDEDEDEDEDDDWDEDDDDWDEDDEE
jgi:hypothetical protein